MHRCVPDILAPLVLSLALLASPVGAQDMNPFVLVPDRPQQMPPGGCYRASQQLFGQIFSFCLSRPGTYSVRGGGVRCDGRMTWRGGREIRAQIHRVSCGRGVAWERASMTCRPAGRNVFGQSGRFAYRTLRCTYFPTVRGEQRRTFTATRR